ncbi:Pseudouridine-metabolizing bifunctional protein [Lachnellula suecica]|uniref:Pseudouridine-metabolizing bifunctional protein n=1 Tax=Lachnellula suecica TaxID=602035 RepID=A0A8T9C479_9HELO|nr:Pseudouridine-metabolizing bifunctional protein [Lachnellula suecica]
MLRLSCRPKPWAQLWKSRRSFSQTSINSTNERTPKLRYISTPVPIPLEDQFNAHDSQTAQLARVIQVKGAIRTAVHNGDPVVALESTIYTHGFPYPDNIDLALDLEEIVLANGGTPATIGVLDGAIRVGMHKKDIMRLASLAGDPETMKVSRRDIPYILGMGIAGRRLSGGTTVAGTMMIAKLVGISVFGTGGLGGVHRGGQDTMDISADLAELGRTPVAVISSGCKSFLDLPRTLEYLETQGVPVCTFADGRTGDIDLPSFYTRDSGIPSPLVIQDAKEAAAMICMYPQAAHSALELTHTDSQRFTRSESGLLFANPIPEEFSIPKAEIDVAINQAVEEAAQQGFHGHSNTPFILSRIKELTQGSSIPANRALIESNVTMATKVAVELAKLKNSNKQESFFVSPYENIRRKNEARAALKPLPAPVPTLPTSPQEAASPPSPRADILVFGSLAMDLSGDFLPKARDDDDQLGPDTTTSLENLSPIMHTSNPSTISESVGGVGHNVALAAHRLSGELTVKLCSRVAEDLAGTAILAALAKEGMDTTGIKVSGLGGKENGPSTAMYIAINDGNKDLVVAVADMAIFTSLGNVQGRLPEKWHDALERKPKWVVVDANWNALVIRRLLSYCLQKDPNSETKTAFEPVSVAKSAGLFPRLDDNNPARIFPNSIVNLATPNQHELAAMHAAARKNGYLEPEEWWQVVNAFGIPSSGARDSFVRRTSKDIADEGLPVQAIQLLPFIPTILTKLGSRGVLMTELLKPEDPRLTDPLEAAYIMSRNDSLDENVGGVYMRLFPAVETVDDVVSVNGVGDTFLGVIVAGLGRGMKLDERLINIAQRGAVMTLRSKEAVSPELGQLSDELSEKGGDVEWFTELEKENDFLS